MKTKSEKVLPKTVSGIHNGGVYLQRVRCGKSNCKCSRGETHSAFYFFTRRRGKLVKIYIRKSQLADFVQMVVQGRNERTRRRRTSQQHLAMLREFRSSLSEHQSVVNTIKGKLER